MVYYNNTVSTHLYCCVYEKNGDFNYYKQYMWNCWNYNFNTGLVIEISTKMVS